MPTGCLGHLRSQLVTAEEQLRVARLEAGQPLVRRFGVVFLRAWPAGEFLVGLLPAVLPLLDIPATGTHIGQQHCQGRQAFACGSLRQSRRGVARSPCHGPIGRCAGVITELA